MTLEPGTYLGPYEILAAIGRGGMREAYRTRDTRLKREIAIKVLPVHVTSEPIKLVPGQQYAFSYSTISTLFVVNQAK